MCAETQSSNDDSLTAVKATANALACDLPADSLARRAVDTTELFARARKRTTLADGTELEFAGDDATAQSLLDFVMIERRCCAHLTFELAFVPDHSSVKLTLRGGGTQTEGIRAWTATPGPGIFVSPVRPGDSGDAKPGQARLPTDTLRSV